MTQGFDVVVDGEVVGTEVLQDGDLSLHSLQDEIQKLGEWRVSPLEQAVFEVNPTAKLKVKSRSVQICGVPGALFVHFPDQHQLLLHCHKVLDEH